MINTMYEVSIMLDNDCPDDQELIDQISNDLDLPIDSGILSWYSTVLITDQFDKKEDAELNNSLLIGYLREKGLIK